MLMNGESTFGELSRAVCFVINSDEETNQSLNTRKQQATYHHRGINRIIILIAGISLIRDVALNFLGLPVHNHTLSPQSATDSHVSDEWSTNTQAGLWSEKAVVT
jgi:hypothetical protein